MKFRPRFFLSSLALVLLAACSGTPTAAERPSRIVILHTNDVHGQVYPIREEGGLSALSALVKKTRAEEEAKGATVLVVDCGDFFQGTPEGNLTKGRMIIDIFNEIGLTALCPGNHDLDYGQTVLRDLAAQAKFPFLCANMTEEKTGQIPAYLTPSIEVAGLRLTGVITPETPRITMPEAHKGLRFENPLTALRRWPESIVLSHCGPEIERTLPGRFVIGGHSHERISEPRYQQTGSSARNLGVVEITPESITARLLTVGTEKDPKVDEIIARYAPEIDRIMDEEIGELTENLPRGGPKGVVSSPLGNLLCDVMREAAGADIALHNRTGVRADMSKGIVRLRDVYQVSPFGNTIVAMDLTGAEILELLEFSVAKEGRHFLEVSGLEFEYDPRGPPNHQVLSVTVSGAPLDPKRTYRVATNSFLASGADGLSPFARGRNRKDTLLDMMVAHRDHLKRHRPLHYKFENRVRSRP